MSRKIVSGDFPFSVEERQDLLIPLLETNEQIYLQWLSLPFKEVNLCTLVVVGFE